MSRLDEIVSAVKQDPELEEVITRILDTLSRTRYGEIVIRMRGGRPTMLEKKQTFRLDTRRRSEEN